jgi:hypothetical protein
MVCRMLRFTLLAVIFAATLGGCHKESTPALSPGETVPLPPASGTPIGYLLDNAGQLKLSDDQMGKLRQLDNSLSARNDGIDTQLREIEVPEEQEGPDKRGNLPPIRNMAPGAVPTRTTTDAGKLHEARAANNKEALEKAFAILDAGQRVEAKKLLDARGVSSPGATSAAEPPRTDDTGVPLEP